MTVDSGEYRARRHEAVTGDHFPACPRCGDLCGRLAQVCAECGTRLYDAEFSTDPTGLSTAKSTCADAPAVVGSPPMHAAPKREDMTPASGTES